MAGINYESILKKARERMEQPDMRQRVAQKIDNYMLGTVGISYAPGSGRGGTSPKPPRFAASKFIEVLRKEISSHIDGSYASGGISGEAAELLSSLDYNKPYRVGDKYYIDIYFNNDLGRPSLVPSLYGGIENVAALLNNGYTASHTVYGVWEGHGDERIASLTSRGGAHFIQQAVRDFMGNYASEYGVLDIEVSDVYS